MNRLILGHGDKIPFLLSQEFSRVTVIDPQGDLAEAFADRVPHDDVVYIDPSDVKHPVGINVLDLTAEQICSLFEMLWPFGWGAQSNSILANCVSVIPKKDTLLGVLKILKDTKYRTGCLRKCKDPVVLANWDFINSWEERQFNAAIAPIVQKVGMLLMNPMRRNMLCQDYTTFNGEKVVIANLNRAKIGDLTAKLIGYMLMLREGPVLLHDMGFFSTHKHETDQLLASIVAQNRFTITLQFLRQVTPTLREELLGIEDKAVFRTNREDAETLMYYLGVLNPTILMDVKPGHALTLRREIAPELPESLKRFKEVVAISRANNARSKATVETGISEFFAN